MKLRTEERILIARGRENLWKKFQEPGPSGSMREEEIETWECLRKTIGELEEEEDGSGWQKGEYKIKELRIRRTESFGVKKEEPLTDIMPLGQGVSGVGGGKKSQAGGGGRGCHDGVREH